MRALDTGALLAWPLVDLIGCLCVPGQVAEVMKHSPERAMLIQSQGPRFLSPSTAAIEQARASAIETGDLSGLAAVDLEILALAIEHGAELVTDDYRLQNVCTNFDHPWTGIIQDGIEDSWTWTLECRGCRRQHPALETKRKGDYGNCPECGAELRLKRIQNSN